MTSGLINRRHLSGASCSAYPAGTIHSHAADQPKRLAEWAELLRRARTREETPAGVRYIFDTDEGLKLRVEALDADEHSCCSFLAFEVIERSDELEMSVTAPPNTGEMRSFLLTPRRSASSDHAVEAGAKQNSRPNCSMTQSTSYHP